MIANSRIDPISGTLPPPSPKFSPSAPPAFLNGTHNPSQNSSLSRSYGIPPPALQPQHPPPPQGTLYPHGMLNVPMMEYSVPGTIQAQPVGDGGPQGPPPASLKPMPQPPPFPALNEVSLNEERQRVRCPYCQTSIVTRVNYSVGVMTHIAAVAVLVVCLPLFWVPYCVDCCKDVDHSCPNCGRAVGKFKRFQ